MMTLFVFRERVRNFYQRYDYWLLPAVKFIFSLIVFLVINNTIGYDTKLARIPIALVLALLSAFTPTVIMVLLAAALSIAHVYLASPILSIIIILIMFILYALFVRFTPKLGTVVLAIPILFAFKIPYLIPIFMGLVAGPTAIVAVGSGVVVYYLFHVIQAATTMQNLTSVEDTLQLYIYVMDNLMKNQQMYITIVIFAAALLVTYFIRRMNFDYAFEVSIAAGAVTNILGFLIAYLALDYKSQIFGVIFGTILSAAIVYVIHFFKLTLDYSGVEFVQFEDDSYYYYVKAVPKIAVTTPQMNIKRYGNKGENNEEIMSEQENYGPVIENMSEFQQDNDL